MGGESRGRAPLVEPASPLLRPLDRLRPGAPAAREPGRLTVAPFRAWRGSPGFAAQDRTFIAGKERPEGPRQPSKGMSAPRLADFGFREPPPPRLSTAAIF